MKIAAAFFSIFFILSAVSAEAQNGRGFGNRGQNRSACCPRFDSSYPVQALSTDKAAGLLFMREEEKLARDVYQAFAQKWNLRIFRNIAAAENRHFEALGSLIARYELSDSALPAAGEFSDGGLQKLYEELVARGSRSISDAMQVGASIEEKDIDDLKKAMSATDNTDILAVYGNLLNGSLNHLAAFKETPGRQGAGRRAGSFNK